MNIARCHIPGCTRPGIWVPMVCVACADRDDDGLELRVSTRLDDRALCDLHKATPAKLLIDAAARKRLTVLARRLNWPLPLDLSTARSTPTPILALMEETN